MTWLRILSLSLSLGLATAGQSQPVVVLDTNWPVARVYADSVALGTASQRVFWWPAGARTLRLTPPESDIWNIPARLVSIPDTAADTLRIAVFFPYHYRIESIPSGADIFLGAPERQRLIGQTPFLGAFDAPLRDTLYLIRSGYAQATFWPGQQVWNRHRIYLRPLQDTRADVQSWEPTMKQRHWITYAALGLAVTATAISVHYKFQADQLYARYEKTGDPALRSRIRTLDLRAGIALGIAQLGLAVVAFRLIFQ